ncbi:heme A synthase [Yimella sp. RIT 621]|uniref:COX15/CtaA family protein n=1 Tax=Yimella sp. RIT 621 TaxID=2510323 RepID=UPI00101D01D9|nr:COX15/CtaA family protein [Yimella sp. RIT 621]RYG77797.1 heme A synthase [Yimella sp. RIT 621]
MTSTRTDHDLSTCEAAGSAGRGFLLPTLSSRPLPRWLTTLFWLNLACQIGIVVTGGLVRLTGSGLGCPEWPQCVEGSITPTRHQEQSWHKYVEFGNRTLTGLLSIVALALLIGIIKGAPQRKGLRLPTAMVLFGIALQAIVGGVTVLTGLNPAIVAAHFMISMLLVAASAWLVWRGREGDAPARLIVRPGIWRLAQGVAAFTAVVLLLGTLVTGSGPHSGDADEPVRLGLDPRTISWLHADAVMLFVGLVIGVLVAVRLTAPGTNAPRAWTALLIVTLLQGLIGYVQYFTDLPWVLVLLHMLGASLLVASVTWALLSLRVREDV